MGCVTLVTRALEGLEEIENVEYKTDQDLFEVRLVEPPLPKKKIEKTVEEAQRQHDERLGLSNRPKWRVQFLDRQGI
ncbi:MAG: cation transporter [Calditrichaeota bacterium]|nr:MAG: cation transporter [Calditrichota bacterium]